MGSSKSYSGAGPSGAEEQKGRGPGKSMETRSKPAPGSFGAEPASDSGGVKPSNRTRGHEKA